VTQKQQKERDIYDVVETCNLNVQFYELHRSNKKDRDIYNC
jgi:hypothetical protein